MLVAYVTAHGYGHGVRSCEVLSTLRDVAPETAVVLVSALPPAFLRTRLPGVLAPWGDRDPRSAAPAASSPPPGGPAVGASAGSIPPLRLRSASFDVGMIQRDSIRADLPATLAALDALVADWDERVEAEARWLEEVGASLVLSDIPGIPLEAAARAGRPGIGLGNFTWNWIYEPHAAEDPRWGEAADRFARAYGRADLLLRLPFSEPMEAFPRQERIPLLAEPGAERRAEIASATGADPAAEWVLLSFTTLDWDEPARARVAALPGVEIFTVRPLEWRQPGFHALDPGRFAFRDVVATCDVVVSKPGYGIVSECVANGKPLVHAERSAFREYPILVEAIELHLRNVRLSERDLYLGDLGPSLERLRSAPEPGVEVARGGREQAVRRILERAGRGSGPEARR